MGCHQRKSAVSDADFEAFRTGNPGMTQKCLDEYRYGGIRAWRPDDPDCYELLPDQRWSGVWVVGFEWTSFCPDPARTCTNDGERGANWLTFEKGAYPGPERPDGTYRIEFIGRRT